MRKIIVLKRFLPMLIYDLKMTVYYQEYLIISEEST